MNPPEITLRDYFAAAALQGAMAQSDLKQHLMDTYAEQLNRIADAMMKARDAPKK